MIKEGDGNMEKYYNKRNICDRCGIRKLSPGKAKREYDKNDNWTGKWLCTRCKSKDFNDLPNSYKNLIKSMSNRRTGTIYQDPRSIFSDDCEELTCKWRKVKNLNIENDNYKSIIDHTRDPEL